MGVSTDVPFLPPSRVTSAGPGSRELEAGVRTHTESLAVYEREEGSPTPSLRPALQLPPVRVRDPVGADAARLLVWLLQQQNVYVPGKGASEAPDSVLLGRRRTQNSEAGLTR